MRPHFLITALALAAASVRAEVGLPDEAAVQTALAGHPTVEAARTRVQAARASARARDKGPHELVLSGSYTRRRTELDGDFNEYQAELSRAFRLPGKAQLDREIGAYGVEVAENEAEDAKHQAALLLAGHWWDWVSASAQARVDAAAVANYEQALAAVKRQADMREAAQLDIDQTAAALASAKLFAAQSAGRAALARTRLETHFPALTLPIEAPDVPTPVMPDQGLGRLQDLVIANSHEIAAADAYSRQADSVAERTRRDQVADPSLGLRVFSERGGEERGAGLIVSVPIGGGHRSALADQAAADASTARSMAQIARFEVRETANADVAEARYRFSAWERAREGCDAQAAALGKLRRGRELGEVDLADLLLGERMFHDAQRIEVDARTEASRALAKLRIDAHDLWLAD